MSSGVADPAAVATLRAMAHPLRLRILSLLTGAAMSAAEVARELGLTHANASYHLRQLHGVGLLTIAEEESVRGGRAKRYRYDLEHPESSSADREANVLYYQALAAELVRRATTRGGVGAKDSSSDAELWVDPLAWERAVDQVTRAVVELHRAAVTPRTPGALHVSVTTALFEMDPAEVAPEPPAAAADRRPRATSP